MDIFSFFNTLFIKINYERITFSKKNEGFWLAECKFSELCTNEKDFQNGGYEMCIDKGKGLCYSEINTTNV